MKYFKKIAVLTMCLILSFNLVACKEKELDKPKEPSITAASSCDSVNFSNIIYNRYNLGNLTVQYPNFLGIDKKSSDFVTMSTKDNSATLKFYKEKNGSSLRKIYDNDMSNLKNINYDSYKDTRFRKKQWFWVL